VFGLRGDINETWRYDVSYQYAEVDMANLNTNYVDINRVANALRVVEGPDGTPVCEVGGECVPYNVFQTGGVTRVIEHACTALLAAARSLSDARSAAAERLGETVTAFMQELGMVGGRFAVAVETGGDAQVGAHGLDAVTFQVSANPGQPLQPLAKVASGGELSRISLAIQVATAELGSIPTLVFDEVDVGIGGGVAEIVGRLLRRLGQARQALCVTHLPQVAAQAHRQLRVQKQAVDGQTYTDISPLGDAARVDEIARMLGGTEITDTTRAHAAEMLRRAPDDPT